jgi:hypothetical protein
LAVGLSTVAVANQMLNGFRNTAFSNAATYIQLHTADPTAAGTTGVSVGSTTRLAATLAAASGGAVALSANVGPWTNGGTSETIAYISVWTAATAGTFLWDAQLTTSKAWVSGDTLTLTTLGMSLAPLAA